MEELTTGQKSGAGVAQTDLARGAAANVLSNHLSQTLGNTLGLDVIDINSLGSLAATSMTVGKYLTTDLFMSYQRSFGQGPDATPGNVTFEYELNRYLLLQLLQGDDRASGFDFIFKYQH
jgi:autotransporter translocation and assembly factor TamB